VEGTDITRSSTSLIAMFVTDAVVVVTVARMLGGQRLGRGRVRARSATRNRW
jgi:hypothetical protein